MTEIRRLEPADLSLYEDLMTMFGEVFDEMDTYTGARMPITSPTCWMTTASSRWRRSTATRSPAGSRLTS